MLEIFTMQQVLLITYEIDSTGTGLELMERRKGNESGGLIPSWELFTK